MPTGKCQPPSRGRAFAAIAACAGAVLLAACHQAPPPPSNVTPEQAVATNLRLTAAGDFDDLMKNRLPAEDYATWRSEWEKAHAQPMPASVAQEQQFEKIMQMLTAPDAEEKLTRQLQPQLARMRGGKGASMPILAGILEAAGKQMIADAPQLGPAQGALVGHGLDALLAWAKAADFSDPGKARQAIDVACDTARKLNVKTLAEWRALDYATTMKNYGLIWRSVERILKLYGLDIAKSLEEAKVTAADRDGSHATVRLEMTLAGKPLIAKWPMLKQGGHWYDEAMLTAWRKDHPLPATSATAAATSGMPAAGSSAPAAATSAAAANS